MDGDTTARLLYLSLLLVAVGGWALVEFRRNGGTALRDGRLSWVYDEEIAVCHIHCAHLHNPLTERDRCQCERRHEDAAAHLHGAEGAHERRKVPHLLEDGRRRHGQRGRGDELERRSDLLGPTKSLHARHTMNTVCTCSAMFLHRMT